MTTSMSSSQNGSTDRPQSRDVDLLAQVTQIVRQSLPISARCRRVAEAISQEFRAPYVQIQLQTTSRSIHHEVVQGGLSSEIWKPLAESVSIEAFAAGELVLDRLRDSRTGVEASICGIPIRDWDDETVGCLVLIFACESDRVARVIGKQLQAVLTLLSTPVAEAQESAVESSLVQNSAVEQIALRYESYDQMAMAIVNGLKNKFGFAEVELGLVQGTRVRVTTISGRAKLHRGAPGVTCIQQAFEECLDAGRALCSHPDLDNDFEARRRYVLHEQWSQTAGGAPVVSIPIKDGDRIVAIIGMRLEAQDSLLPSPLRELEQKLAPLGPGIAIADRLHRSWYKVAWHSGMRRLGGAARIQQGLLLLAAIAAVWTMVWGVTSHPYIEAVHAEVASSQKQVFAAPYAAVLQEVLVRPGDQVSAGTPLFRFDIRLLETQLDEASATAELSRIERARALANQNASAAAEAHAHYQAALAQVELLSIRIREATVVAREPGVVVGDDPLGRVGEEIAQGDTVVEIANDGGATLKLKIPETLIQDVSIGCQGTFALMARPDQLLSFEITSIERAALPIDGKNIYWAEARLDATSDSLWLGTTGTARIELGERSGAWLLWHSPMRYLRNQVNQL